KPEGGGDNLGEGRLMTLPMAVSAGEHRDRARGMDPDAGRLVEARTCAQRADNRRGGDAAGLEICREADPAELAAGLRLPTPLLEAGNVRRLLGNGERALIVPAVVLQGDRGLVGESVGRDEVLPADLQLVHLHLARRLVHEALEQISRLRPAGAAIGVD